MISDTYCVSLVRGFIKYCEEFPLASFLRPYGIIRARTCDSVSLIILLIKSSQIHQKSSAS